ncbi:MAG: hypothetical protein ACRC8S_07670 [Fimbriiglobus sp.]
MTPPDWLTKREGSLKPGIRDFITHVMIGDQPQYRLEVRPAAGKYMCTITQSINGKRLDDGSSTYATSQDALAGGLVQLQAKLGW